MKEKKKSAFWADFKAFITKGNILQLAIAVVIGAAFGKIITALVNEIIMPLVSLALGGGSLADLRCVIKAAEYKRQLGGNVKKRTVEKRKCQHIETGRVASHNKFHIREQDQAQQRRGV